MPLGQGLAYGAQVEEVVVMVVTPALPGVVVTHHRLLGAGAAVTLLRGRHRG